MVYMKKILSLIFIFYVICASCAVPGKSIPGKWQEHGVLAYDYTYARSVMGFRMRRDGWICKVSFTAGKKGIQEHSVWRKGLREKQLMIWRIDTGKTGYSIGEILSGRKGGK